MTIPPHVTAQLAPVEFCCPFHRTIYAHKLTAQWMEEVLEDRPCLLCDNEEVVATGCHVPKNQAQVAGSPELRVAFYKLCQFCIKRDDMAELVRQVIQLEIERNSKTIH